MIDKKGKQNEQDDDFSKFMPVEFLKRLPGMDSAKVEQIIKQGKQNGLKTVVDICR